jgi:hypothetical protein
MAEDFDLSDNPVPYIVDKLIEEAKNVYAKLFKLILEQLKDVNRELERGEPNQLIQPDILNRIIITEDDFIKLYISEFRFINIY